MGLNNRHGFLGFTDFYFGNQMDFGLNLLFGEGKVALIIKGLAENEKLKYLSVNIVLSAFRCHSLIFKGKMSSIEWQVQ